MEPSKTNATTTPIMRLPPSTAPPRPYQDQYRGMTQNSPQPLSSHSQGSSASSKGGHPPVHPPLLSQAPNLQAYDARITLAATAPTFAENRMPNPHDTRYQAQVPLTISMAHVPTGYLPASSLTPSVRPSASSSQSYLSKPSVLPPPTVTRDFHEDKPSQPGWEAWKCTNCGNVFVDKLQFQGHSCVPEVQQRQFTYERGSQQGPDAHSENPQTPYKCGVCSKLFTSSVNLSTHMRIHGGSKSFDCQNCGKSFAHASLLSRHKKNPGECTK